jgi:hypothetical protein
MPPVPNLLPVRRQVIRFQVLFLNLLDQSARDLFAGRMCTALNIGKQKQAVQRLRPGYESDRVSFSTELDLVNSYSIIFIYHRNNAKLKQRVQRIPGVQKAPPI